MYPFELLLRISLALVFFLSALGKLLAPSSLRALIDDFELPSWLTPAIIGLPWLELALSSLLLFRPTSRVAGVISLVLIGVFCAIIVRSLHRGHDGECHCFGSLIPTKVGSLLLARNAVLLIVSLLIATAPSERLSWPGISRLAAVTIGTGCVLVVAVLGLYSLISRERHEAQSSVISAGADPEPGDNSPGALSDRERRILLFVDPDCPPCRALLPTLDRWQNDDGKQQLVVVVEGRPNEEFSALLTKTVVVADGNGELAARYGASSTPAAAVPDAGGKVHSLVVGLPAVQAFLAGETGIQTPQNKLPVPVVDGNSTSARSRAGPELGPFGMSRRKIVTLGLVSSLLMKVPSLILGQSSRGAVLTSQAGVRCPSSCGSCTICETTGSGAKVKCLPCHLKQPCAGRSLCENYANELPAFRVLASYLMSKGFHQDQDPTAQGLQRDGTLTVFSSSTEYKSGSATAPRATLIYTLTNSGESAWVAFMDKHGKVNSVASASSSGQVVTAPLASNGAGGANPSQTTSTSGKTVAAPDRVLSQDVSPGYSCNSECSFLLGVSQSLLVLPAAVIEAPEAAVLAFSAALFAGGLGLVGAPNASYMVSILSALQSGSMLNGALSIANKVGRGLFCDEICKWSLQGCCSYGGGCWDSLSECANKCPESLAHLAPCLVYVTGEGGARVYLTRF